MRYANGVTMRFIPSEEMDVFHMPSCQYRQGAWSPADDEANQRLERPRRKGFELPTIG
jgi:hypothetical protein